LSSVQTQNISATPVQNTRTAISDRNCEAGEVVIEIRGHFIVERGERRTSVSVGDHGLSIINRRSGRLCGGGGGGGNYRFWYIRCGTCCVRRDADGRSTSHHRSGGGGRPSIGRIRGRVVLVSVDRSIVVGGRSVLVGDTVGRGRLTSSRVDRVGQLCHGRVVCVIAHVRIRVGGIRLWFG